MPRARARAEVGRRSAGNGERAVTGLTKKRARANLSPAVASVIVRGRRVFASLVVAAFVGGVVFGAPAAAAARSCRYLKVAEVRRVVGVDAVSRASSPVAPEHVTVCAFDVGTQSDSSVHVWVQRDEDVVEKGFVTAKRAFAADVEPVTGFGRRAFYVTGGFNVLYVLRGGTLIYVQYSTPSDDDAVTKATVSELMKIVLTRA